MSLDTGMPPSSPSSADEPTADGSAGDDSAEAAADVEAADVRCVLEALHDDDCRAILRSVSDRPKTATELSNECDIPLSTIYRKLDVLTRSCLLKEGTRVQTGGKHAMQYELHVVDVHVSITDDGHVDVAVPTADARFDAP